MKRVLIIEDDIDVQKIYSQKLENSGYKVVLASDAIKAHQLIKDFKPHIIILDIMLPGKMNGFEFLESIKGDKAYKKIPVIVLTNLDTEKANALKVGANDYLIKASTDLNEIVAKVKKYIG